MFQLLRILSSISPLLYCCDVFDSHENVHKHTWPISQPRLKCYNKLEPGQDLDVKFTYDLLCEYKWGEIEDNVTGIGGPIENL